MRRFLGKDFMRLTGRQDDLKFKLSVFSLTRFLCRNRLISVGLSDPPFLMLSTLLSNFCSEKTYFCSEKETYKLFLCSDAYINFFLCVFSIVCHTSLPLCPIIITLLAGKSDPPKIDFEKYFWLIFKF